MENKIEIKKLNSLVRRAKKAMNSFSVCGDMLLVIEFQDMQIADLQTVQAFFQAKGVAYGELNRIIDRKLATQPKAA